MLRRLQQMTPQILNGDAHLFPVRPALRFSTRFTRYGIGDKVFTGPNPPYGALISYYLKDKPDDKTTFKVQIFDRTGKLIQEIDKPSKEKGLNRVTWNLRFGGAEVRRPPSEEETAFAGPPRGPQVLPGTYTVKVTIGIKDVRGAGGGPTRSDNQCVAGRSASAARSGADTCETCNPLPTPHCVISTASRTNSSTRKRRSRHSTRNRTRS